MKLVLAWLVVPLLMALQVAAGIFMWKTITRKPDE